MSKSLAFVPVSHLAQWKEALVAAKQNFKVLAEAASPSPTLPSITDTADKKKRRLTASRRRSSSTSKPEAGKPSTGGRRRGGEGMKVEVREEFVQGFGRIEKERGKGRLILF